MPQRFGGLSPSSIVECGAAPFIVYLVAHQYFGYATKRGIVARLNSRTLHSQIVPRGAGIVVGSVFVFLLLLAHALAIVPASLVLAFGVGGVVATGVGFVDDVKGIAARWKLLVHILLSAWLMAVWYGPLYGPFLMTVSMLGRILIVGVCLFIPVWFINVYNFIDGIDGLAVGGAVYACAATVLLLALRDAPADLRFVAALLGCCSIGLWTLNAPPARMFIGDAGSIFFGYCFAAMALWTVFTGQMTVWTWLILFSYFIGDTTTTTLSRIVLVPKWYGEHRSHAYQNLARVLQSHACVTYGVTLFHVCWALPLAIWSVWRPQYASIAAACALLPPVFWTLRFGPRYSRD